MVATFNNEVDRMIRKRRINKKKKLAILKERAEKKNRRISQRLRTKKTRRYDFTKIKNFKEFLFF